MTTETKIVPGPIRIYPYNQSSKSAIVLCQQMVVDGRANHVLLLRREGSKYKGNPSHTVINWGSSEALPEACLRGRVVNPSNAVARATNKLTFFQYVSSLGGTGPRIPPWTQSKAEVASWLSSGRTAFARTKLSGNSGEGIVDVQNPNQLDSIKEGTLFTQYVPKKQEWRIHVGFGEPFEIQRKAYKAENKESGLEGYTPNWRIRNHQNGFIFERNFSEQPPKDVIDQAVLAVTDLGLDFGAVDVIYNVSQSQAYVLEVNTAPGIENSTVTSYKDMFFKNIL